MRREDRSTGGSYLARRRLPTGLPFGHSRNGFAPTKPSGKLLAQPYKPPAPHRYLNWRSVSRIRHAGCDLHVFSGHHPESCLWNFIAVPLAQPIARVMNCAERKLTSHTRIAHRPVRHGMFIDRDLVRERQVRFFRSVADSVDRFSIARQHVDRHFVFERSTNECREGKETKYRRDQQAICYPFHARSAASGMRGTDACSLHGTVNAVYVQLQTCR